MLVVDAAHQGGRGREHLVHEDEDGLLGAQLDAFADNVDKLADRQVCRHEILLLVDGGNVRLLGLLADDGDAVGILLANTLGLGLESLISIPLSQGQQRWDGVPCASRTGARP